MTISIHALLAESDCIIDIINNIIDDFYPRSPCGERPLSLNTQQRHLPFLSTLSLRRATVVDTVKLAGPVLFLSTLSLRRATDTSSLMQCQVKFLSTLSLRRATQSPPSITPTASNFYPRSPCGERPRRRTYQQGEKRAFLSTLSLRRATSDKLIGTV